MLTRLQITNFKNLRDVDVRFGPFTCIAGVNGVGKSNLFDAMRFLGQLADRTLLEAAVAIRSGDGRSADIGALFSRVGDDVADSMRFVADLLVAKGAVDDLGQEAKAASTYLRYTLAIRARPVASGIGFGDLEIVEESLVPLSLADEPDALGFPHTKAWLDSVRVVRTGPRRTAPFITTTESTAAVIQLAQNGRQGRLLERPAAGLKRTMLSTVTAEHPTQYLARREMQSWRLLQLEPSALRESDPFTAASRLEANGAHLAASLYRIAHGPILGGEPAVDEDETETTYAQLGNRLAELIDGVEGVRVDRDDLRQLLTLTVRDQTGTAHPARSLSDGTLRFLALGVLGMEAVDHEVLCLEEPENGIHPKRIPAMLSLLHDITVASDYPVDESNPLRQVVVNTHSPTVVAQVADDSLLVADLAQIHVDGRLTRGTRFRGLPNTWRAGDAEGVPRGLLLSYLNPVDPEPVEPVVGFEHGSDEFPRMTSTRVVDRMDVRRVGTSVGGDPS